MPDRSANPVSVAITLALLGCTGTGGDAPTGVATPTEVPVAMGTVVLPELAWAPAGAQAPPPGERMTPRFMLADGKGERIATIEDELELPMRSWLRIRGTNDFAVGLTAPLCLAGDPSHRVAVPCTDTAPHVRAAAFSPDGSALAIACASCAAPATPTAARLHSLHVVDAATGALRFAVAVDLDADQLAWGEAGLVIAGYKTDVGFGYAVIDPRTGAELRAHALDEGVVGFSPDALAYVTGASKQVRLLDGSQRWSTGSSGDKVVLYRGGGAARISSIGVERIEPGGRQGDHVYCRTGDDIVAVTPDGRYTLAIDLNTDAPDIVRLVDLDSEALVFEEPVEGAIDAAALLPDGSVLVGGRPGVVRRIVGRPKARALALAPDGSRLAAAETEGPVTRPSWWFRVRDAVTLEPRVSVAAGPIAALAFAPDGGRVALVLAEQPQDTASIVVRSAVTGAIERTVAVPFTVHAIAWGEQRIAAAGAVRVALIDPATGTSTVMPFPDDASLESLAPDASAVAIRFQGGPYHEARDEGGHATIVPPATLERLALDSGTRTVLLSESRGGVVALAGGAWLQVDGAEVTRHDAAGTVIDRVPRAGDVVITSPDGGRVLQSDGSYTLTVRALGADAIEVSEALDSHPLAVALAADGITYIAPRGGGIARRQRGTASP